MAHRNERRLVRDGRHAARRRLRALPLAALLLALSAGAPAAQAPPADQRALASSGVYDLPAWWSEPGRPGWNPVLDWGGAAPWTLAGHVLGGWALDEPRRAAASLPFPGVRTALTPIAFYDSVHVESFDSGAWRGWNGALARAIGETRNVFARHASAIVDLRNGDFGLDENALTIERGDSLKWLRADVMSSNRGAVSGFDRSGRHLWGVAGALRRGRHEFDAAYTHRGSAARLLGGEEEAVRGESGSLAWAYARPGFDAGLSIARGRTRHESFGDEFSFLDYSRREAQEVVVGAEVGVPLTRGRFGARAEWRRAEVKRFESDELEARAQAFWAAARLARTLGPGAATLDFGAGRHEAIDRFEWAPAVAYELRRERAGARVSFQRIVVPVWSDLAVAEDPFLQSTWVGAFEGDAKWGLLRGHLAVFGGRTRNRALLLRLPLEELWLRAGAAPDPARTPFTLVVGDGVWSGRRWELGGEGFLFERRASEVEPRVDPRYGARAFAGLRLQFFEGDLGIALRPEVAGVASRESDAFPPRFLPGYLTTGVSATITLAEAIITIRARNLEDRPQPQVWIDNATGSEALGPGRELRFALTLRLRN